MTAKKTKKPSKTAEKLEVIYRPVADLQPDPRNARQHSAAQITKIRASIRQFGFTQPLLLRPNGMIGAGHGRWEAAKAEGMVEVPTITIDMPEDKWRAYAVTDNSIPLEASWNLEILGEELQAIEASGLDVVGLGLEDLIPSAGEEVEGSKTGSRLNQTVIQFNVVFDNEDQQAKFFTFVRQLKEKYPGEATMAARLTKFLEKAKV